MNILIATGGAPHSQLALQFGGLLARDLHAYPTIVMVIKSPTERSRAEQVLSNANARVRSFVPSSEVRIREGHPAEEIIKEAEEGGYDLIVAGERQHHTFTTRFLIGATAERVIEHAPCPVVVAKGHVTPVRRILLCSGARSDNTLCDRAVDQLEPVLRLASDLTILHVMSQVSTSPKKSGDVLVATTESLVERATREGRLLRHDRMELEACGLPSTIKVRHGLVVEEILHEAQAGEYDLIVVGAHQGTGWRRILLDDITHQILAGADRPILVVR